MKLKFYTNTENEKNYTLKDNINNRETKDAHYKFIKIRSIKPSKEDSSEQSPA